MFLELYSIVVLILRKHIEIRIQRCNDSTFSIVMLSVRLFVKFQMKWDAVILGEWSGCYNKLTSQFKQSSNFVRRSIVKVMKHGLPSSIFSYSLSGRLAPVKNSETRPSYQSVNPSLLNSQQMRYPLLAELYHFQTLQQNMMSPIRWKALSRNLLRKFWSPLHYRDYLRHLYDLVHFCGLFQHCEKWVPIKLSKQMDLITDLFSYTFLALF